MQGCSLVPAIGGIAVGHFSIDGELKPEHYNSNTVHHNVFVAEASDNDSGLPLSLMSELIEFFSFSGQTVLDIMSGFGERHKITKILLHML